MHNWVRRALIGLLLLAPQTAMAQETLVSGDALVKKAAKTIPDIDTAGLQALLKKHPEAVLVDVRTHRETVLTGGTIGVHQNVMIQRGWLEFRIQDEASGKDTPIVVYCGTNQRSPLAAVTLKQLGYTNVRNYAEGFFAWKKAGLEVESPDLAVGTPLFQRPVKVADGVWSAIGALAPGTYENGGHNNNLSFIITRDGVVVINAGDNALLAEALHAEIKARTDLPVKFVVLENGQGHAAFGSSYWKAQGAKIIAHEDAVSELKHGGEERMARMKRRMRDKAFGTGFTLPDISFSDKHVIELGGERIELLNLGPAHSPGDIVTWIPSKKVAISGDMAFHQRLLPVFEETDTAGWLESWQNFKDLGARIIVPGHGSPTTIDVVTKYTHGYLTYLRGKVGALIENGGDLKAAYLIDQTPYRHLKTYRQLARRNAGRVFRAMEFE